MRVVTSVYSDTGKEVFNKLHSRVSDESDVPNVIEDIEPFLLESFIALEDEGDEL